MSPKQNSPVFPMSRRRRKVIFILCLTALVVLALLDSGFFYPRIRQYSAASAGQTGSYDIEKYHGKTFNVINVVDGDTIDIDIPDGRDNYTRIRLWGIDTPETKSEQFGMMYFGPEAFEYTKQLALGKQVCIYLDEQRDTRDKYERLLAYVRLPDGRILNEVLLSEGFAYADLRFRHDFYNKFNQLESAARSGQKGLWLNVTPEQMPQWLQERQ